MVMPPPNSTASADDDRHENHPHKAENDSSERHPDRRAPIGRIVEVRERPDPLLPNEDDREVDTKHDEADEDADVLMVVGHAPGIPALAELLCDGEGSVEGHRRMAEGYPTCGLAVLQYAGRWSDLTFGDARLERFHVCRDGARAGR